MEMALMRVGLSALFLGTRFTLSLPLIFFYAHLGLTENIFEDSSPAAYPHLSIGALEDLQHDMTTILHQTLSHQSLHPNNLGIVAHKKSWLLNLDIIVLSDMGNIYDAMFMAARAALWDTKVPRTRSVEYQARPSGSIVKEGGENGDMDVDEGLKSGFDTREYSRKTMDFELPDYWDEGEPLNGRNRWPVCVTLNLVRFWYR